MFGTTPEAFSRKPPCEPIFVPDFFWPVRPFLRHQPSLKRNPVAIAPDSGANEENAGNVASAANAANENAGPKAAAAHKVRAKPDRLVACNAVKCVAMAATAELAACLADSPAGAPSPISFGVISGWSTTC